MLSHLNLNFADATPVDVSNATSGQANRAGVSLPIASFAGELQRSALKITADSLPTGNGFPASGNMLPATEIVSDMSAAAEIDVSGLSSDELKTIFRDLEELAEMSGQRPSMIYSSLVQVEQTTEEGLPVLTEFNAVYGSQSPLNSEGEATPVEGQDVTLGTGALSAEPATPDTSLNPDTLSPEETTLNVAGSVLLPAQGSGAPSSMRDTEAMLNPLETQATDKSGVDIDLKKQLLMENQRQSGVDLTRATLEGRRDPVPASIVHIDGQLARPKEDRFRPLGLTPPIGLSPDASVEMSELNTRPSVTESISRFEMLGTISEGLRQDSNLLQKPLSGAYQVHAPTVSLSPNQNLNQLTPSLGTNTVALTDTLQTSVSDPNWGERVGERVALMANNRLQNAELRLTPAELGPLRVKVSMEDGLANVSFVAQHAVTRDALEQAMPRLREMLEQQGINLGQSSVEEQGSQGAFADADSGDADSAQSGSNGRQASGNNEATEGPVQRVSTNLLDTFV